jgi:DNA-binding transcriptional LysR family regulator
MDTRLLRMFSAVARLGSAIAASRALHLTPSAISHGLKDLETQLGCRLFERKGNKMFLNQAGEHLFARIEKPLADLDAAAESVKKLTQWGQSRLRVGAAASACEYILPPVLRELRRGFPKVTFQIQSGDMPTMMDLIQEGRVDLALGVMPPANVNLELRPIFKDELLFVFAPSHPWSSGQAITKEELRSQPIILYHRSSLTAQMIEGYFRTLDVTPSTIMEVGNIGAIKELVRLNLGVSVLAPWTVHRELARGSLKMRPLGSRTLRRPWVIAFEADRRLTLVEESFCRLCRQAASGLRMDRRDLPAP